MTAYDSEIEITFASADDAAGVQNVLKESSRAIYLTCGYSEADFEKRFEDSQSEASILQCAANIDSLTQEEIYLVARKNGEILGLCYAEKDQIRNTLHAMYVLPASQGRGLGKRLWDGIQGFLNHSNATVLNVFACNSNAIGFYRALGFVEIGKRIRSENFRSASGVDIDEIEMELRPSMS